MNAMRDFSGYVSASGLSAGESKTLADLNNDGSVNNRDIQVLLNELAGSSMSIQAVPEPSGLALTTVSIFALLASRVSLRRSQPHV